MKKGHGMFDSNLRRRNSFDDVPGHVQSFKSRDFAENRVQIRHIVRLENKNLEIREILDAIGDHCDLIPF